MRRMKRRQFMHALAIVPAATTAVLGQQPQAPPVPGARGGGRGNLAPTIEPENDPLKFGSPDEAGEAVLKFFTPEQFSAMKRAGVLLMPAVGPTAPGAAECHAAEFLDFLLSKSPADRQEIYRAGLDTLNAQAKKRFSKAFADTDDTQADALFEPLRRTWTYAPADPLEQFLRVARRDVRTATVNSYEYSVASGNPRPTRVLRPLD